ncbi:MAG: hypothetical protein FJ224_05390 [Lentisphaerae bacterium]|nr:hypothetical protein [Lentisphaerota bacterium]
MKALLKRLLLTRAWVFPRDLRSLCMRLAVFPQLSELARAMPTCEIGAGFHSREELYSALSAAKGLSESRILYLEFGVFKGDSIRWWMRTNRCADSRFVGFDTFTGLPEDWGRRARKGLFSTQGAVPDVGDPRGRFVKGLFQETLPAWVESNRAELASCRKVIHMDADLYSSTLFVLCSLHPHMRPGDILIFDDFNSVRHEFRAFLDYSSAYLPHTELLGADADWRHVAMQVKEHE